MRTLAICAGIGGLELGIRVAVPGAGVVCYVEREIAACETLADRMAEGAISSAPIWSDLSTFDPEPWRGLVDCVTSGDPCQPNSLAGKRRGSDDDRWLIGHVLRCVDILRPATFFRENVPGNADGQLEALVPALEAMGYGVAAGIFSAGEVGAAHRRERLFIMADRISPKPQGCRPDGYRPGEREAVKRGGGDVGNAHNGGDGRDACEPGREPIERVAVDGPGACLFAPGPDDAGWPGIIAARPDLKPAVRGMAYGTSARVDQLRALGNAVVPLAAAYAWRTLSARLAEANG